MKSLILTLFLVVCLSSAYGQYSVEDQITMAVLAAPEQAREGAHVYGFDKEGKMVTLREGTNDFIVRSHDPNKDGFEVGCNSRKYCSDTLHQQDYYK